MPETTTEVRAFVNAAGYFRHLIKGYAEKSGPLTDLTGGPKVNQSHYLLKHKLRGVKSVT
jgi:hypothetical protein